jgi:hypothetical protein
MRIWDIDPKLLCNNHLLGEHRELHAVWNIITRGRKGYSYHPETGRWKGKLRALFNVHQEIAREMAARGFRHRSPLDETLATGAKVQDVLIDSLERQAEILKQKGCNCSVATPREFFRHAGE